MFFSVGVVGVLYTVCYHLEDSGSCPTRCRCYNSAGFNGSLEYSVECVGQNILNVPVNLPFNVTYLYLSNNYIQELNYRDFSSYAQIRFLDLSFNIIKRLDVQSLGALLQLEKLYLNDNSLTMASDSTPSTVFDNLTSLRVLTLHNNNVSVKSYRDDLYEKLTSLQTLYIDGVCDDKVQLGDGFKELQSLTTLGIYGRLCAITNTTFENLNGLPVNELIIKTRSNLTSLAPGSFSHFSNLTILDLGFNRAIMEIVITGIPWFGLRNTTIKTVILTRIQSEDMILVNIPSTFFTYLNETKIENLLLNKNNIGIFSPGISQNLPFLKYWDMSYNRLSLVGGLTDEFRFLKEVVYIDCSQQQKRYDGPVKRDLKRVRKVQLTNWHPVKSAARFKRSDLITQATICESKVSNAIKPCPNVSSEYGQIPVRPLVAGDPWCIHFPPKLETFNLSASLSVSIFGSILPQISAFGSVSLRETIYSSNGIQYLTGPIVFYDPNPNISYTLDLSYNSIQCIFETFLLQSVKNGLKLTNLYLSSNNLRQQLQEDINGNLFQNYRDLVELRLDYNNIQKLQPAVFRSLSNLVTLNLSKNALTSLDFEFIHMRKLQVLDLSYNPFLNIDDTTLSNMDALMKYPNFSLNLLGNQIVCSCQTLNFWNWVKLHAGHIVRLDEYSCLYKNITVKFTQINMAAYRGECQETSYGLVIGLAVGCTIGLLIVVAVIIVLIIIYQKGKLDTNCNSVNDIVVFEQTTAHHDCRIRDDFVPNGSCLNESGINPDVEYKDAFVICAHQDDEWVGLLEENLGQLSREESELDTNGPRFNFFIHKYDFLGGKLITESIDIAIHTTRKKVLVLSKHFIESHWCVYEFERALHRDISTGTNSIIPVILDPLTDIMDKMSPSLKDLCSRTTYIKWPENSSDCIAVDAFWQKLSNALSDRCKKQ